MQASLDSFSLKPFTRALQCLSKYGDDLSIYASSSYLCMSATNSSMSAFCRFKYSKDYFSTYSVNASQSNNTIILSQGDEEVVAVSGQLLTKSLLSILKHRTVEKSVDRCELSMVEGTSGEDVKSDSESSVESRLVVRLHCKHGVVKTHRLLLSAQTSIMTPSIPDDLQESRLTIGPRAVREMIEHFPSSKGSKNDSQLVWNFEHSEVQIRSLESSIDSRGRASLSTELTISADEFDLYDVAESPITLAFHLREFNATISYAESMTLPLELRFTESTSPLFIDVEGDNFEVMYVISTSQVPGQRPKPRASAAPSNSNGVRKRSHEEAAADRASRASSNAPDRIKKPMKVVQRTEPVDRASREPSILRGGSAAPSGSMPPPPPKTPARASEPLFLPASQLSQADEAAIRESGLGIENMNADELTELLEGEGEEVVISASQMNTGGVNDDDWMMEGGVGDMGADPAIAQDATNGGPESFELWDDSELGATQSRTEDQAAKHFRPLFED